MSSESEIVSASVIEKHIVVSDQLLMTEIKPSQLLAEASGLSQQKIKQAMKKGAVWLTRSGYTQRLRRADKKLQEMDELHLYYNEEVLQQEPSSAKLIADEREYSIWFKPYGMYSQGSKWGDHCTIQRWVEMSVQPQRPAFIVHRLDRATSGLLILAHSKKVAQLFSRMFEEREIDKYYQAIVLGDFSQYKSNTFIEEVVDGKSAKSVVCCLSYNKDVDMSLVNIKLETGRKHQIRQHLSGLGFPVVGDRLYGVNTAEEVDLQLQAYQLQFMCPVTQVKKEYILPDNLKLEV